MDSHGGLGGMGGAQPLAATWPALRFWPWNAAKAGSPNASNRLCRRAGEGLGRRAGDARDSKGNGKPISVALLGNIVDVLNTLLERGIKPDVLTDQTSRMTRSMATCRKAGPSSSGTNDAWAILPARRPRPRCRWPACRIPAALQAHGNAGVRLRNNIRQVAFDAGSHEPSISLGSCRNTYGRYSAAVSALSVGWRSRATRGHLQDDAKVKELIPDDPHLHHWLNMARSRIHFQGLPARICWVGLGQRHRLGLAFNEMVRSGELSAPS